ncbi:hypothetical protein AB0B89_36480 [Sphaerisporangium sp. NPDC049002]|uniref:trypsin-like serine peptidase n=1 Tax=Sphaerisporangium sp. NPDC049002 TaxID=3155392 RepID=UPI00340638A0
MKNVNLPKTIGKVFFTVGDKEYWCSGSSIQSKYHNLVATAGHCVFDEGVQNGALDNWVFIPGYYQGKAPWGIYVGKAAYTHYDFAVYEDYDSDYAFVTVYNGIAYTGAEEVSKAKWDAWGGEKKLDRERVSEKTYQEWLGKGGVGEVIPGSKTETVGPDFPGAVFAPAEVNKQTYDAAADLTVKKPGAKAFTKVEHVTQSEYDGYEGLGTKSTDDNGNYLITHFFVKSWVKPGAEAQFYIFHYVIFYVKDAGRLGDNVGGQGFTWNQKVGQPVYIFGYPAAAHPDGDTPYTGVTPKWCYGKTFAAAAAAKFKAEAQIGLKCSMTAGSSGGPWILKYSSTKRLGYINGVTSLIGDADGNGRIDFSTSPYFDTETYAIYKSAANLWSGSIVTKDGGTTTKA